MIKRYPTKQIFVGNVPVGGDAPIPVQSMTFTKTSDVKATVEQITRLHFAGADIVRVAVPNMEAALALKEIKSQIDVNFYFKPLKKDISFLENKMINILYGKSSEFSFLGDLPFKIYYYFIFF